MICLQDGCTVEAAGDSYSCFIFSFKKNSIHPKWAQLAAVGVSASSVWKEAFGKKWAELPKVDWTEFTSSTFKPTNQVSPGVCGSRLLFLLLCDFKGTLVNQSRAERRKKVVH